MLTLTDLAKGFGSSPAVRRIDLTIEPGDMVSLLGPSGCGKTTTLRLIAGFETPDRGTITLDGTVISSPRAVLPPEQRKMSMIFQSYALWPHMSARENIAYGFRLRGRPSSETRRRVDDLLEVVRLRGLGDRYPAALSGGQQQRVALARAMAAEPRVLLLDEPLSNLDANLREAMRFEIRRLHEAFGITSVYVTHDQGEALALSDRIVVMNEGRVEQIGTPQEIYREPATPFVATFIGRSNLLQGILAGPDAIRLGGSVLRCRNSVPNGSGGPAAVSFRLGAVRLAEEPPAHNALPARVAGRLFLGDYVEYQLELVEGAGHVQATIQGGRSYGAGNQVYVHVPPEHCYLFAETTAAPSGKVDERWER